ncbi:two-component sensor histidine kinase [Sorangium cellulosum So ce56]|uniref:histidine kinase n=1 Tax=Sorangium cellulosum (strain So ce56) TaxID=448385 RepID=A9GGF4_SORC5|nr:two-component sensor histidine kinase [Sorangium cellulosum So ce56]
MKFTPPDGTITLRADVSGRFVRFSVTDTGLGIGADKLPRIFERYFGERRKHNGGLGLGLFIAKAIVESHHESLEVESSVGEGSSFAFTVPILRQACATNQARDTRSTTTTTSANGSPAA